MKRVPTAWIVLICCFRLAFLASPVSAQAVERFNDSTRVVPVEIKAAYTVEAGEKMFSYRVAFRRSFNTLAFFIEPANSNSNGLNISIDALYKEGELITLHKVTDPDQTRLTFDIRLRQSSRPPDPGDIYTAGASFPTAGYIDGYSFESHFPVGSSTVESSDSEAIHISSSTKYGDARCTVDSSRGYLPTSMQIHKSSSHLSNSGRPLSEVRLKPDDPQSALSEIKLSLRDVKFGRAEGNFYISSCELTKEMKTVSGKSAPAEVFRWKVTSFNTGPNLANGGIPPLIEVQNGERFVAEGAEQLPYVWSASEMWAVPMVSDLDSSGSHQGGLIALAVGGVLIFAAAFLYLRRRSS